MEYFHVVFTLPAEIARIAYWNKKAVYDLLFEASAETVMTIAADPRRLGARVGMTSVLHTWGSALTHHPHVHMIVPGGGLSPDGARWVPCRPGFFLHVRVLSRLFRRLFLQGLLALHRAGVLVFFGDLAGFADAGAFAAWLAPFRKSEWVVYSPNGWSMPSRPSAVPRRCWPTSAATPTASPSRTAAWSARTPRRWPSAGRTTASSPATGKRSCGSPRTSSSAGSCFTCCPTAFTASGTTACSPRSAKRQRSFPIDSTQSPRLPPWEVFRRGPRSRPETSLTPRPASENLHQPYQTSFAGATLH